MGVADLGRLRWRCRRGMKELDVLLERWLATAAPAATEAEIATFERMLDLQDPELVRYLLAGEIPADPEFALLAARLRSF